MKEEEKKIRIEDLCEENKKDESQIDNNEITNDKILDLDNKQNEFLSRPDKEDLIKDIMG